MRGVNIWIRWHPKKVLLRLKMNWEKEKNNLSTFWYSSAGLKIWTPINKSQKINFIGGHTLLNKKCRKFYILGSEFFFILTKSHKCGFHGRKTLIWPENDRKWQKMAEKHGFSALEATFLQFRQIKKQSLPNM